jgi:hypothetical protein
MADPVLQNLSDYADFLTNLGYNDPGKYGDAYGVVKDMLRTALTIPGMDTSISEKADEFATDYSDDSPDAQAALKNFLWGDPDFLVENYVKAGGTITDELAPLICSRAFAPSDQAFFNALETGLVNGRNETPPVQPAALVVKTFGELAGNSFALPIATGAVEAWLSYATGHHLQTNPDLLDAYANLNPAYATPKILGYIQGNMGTDGSCPSDLMEEYRKLNEEGYGADSPSSDLPPTGYPQLQFADDFEQHTVSGWSYLALTSLLRQQQANGQVDTTMLANLDKEDAWAGDYFRWQVLQQQKAVGQPLNTDYLTSLAGTRPAAVTDLCEQILNDQVAKHQNLNNDLLKIVFQNDAPAAINICMRSFADAYQPTNRLAPTSVPGPDPTYSLTNQSQPTIRVSLSSMGAARPRVGDLIKLYDTDGKVIGENTVTLTQTIIGFADIQVGQTVGTDVLGRSSLSAGQHSITSQFFPASGQPLSSDMSMPLPVNVVFDFVAPTVKGANWNGSTIVVKFNAGAMGLANVLPDLNDFTISHYNRVQDPAFPTDPTKTILVPADPPTTAPTSVAIDGVNNALILTAGNFSQVTHINYNASYGAPQLQDILGNPIVIDAAVPWQSGMPIPTAQPNPYPGLPPARTLDMDTWSLLNQYDTVDAQQVYGHFRAANLLTSSYPDITNMSLLDAFMAKGLARSYNLEQALGGQVTALNSKNNEMKLDNVVYGDLKNLLPQIPTATSSDTTIASVLGDKFQSMADDINASIQAAGLTDFFPSPNGMMDSTVTLGQLQGATDKLKTAIDNLSTETNSDMLSVQSNTNKRNETIQMVSDLVSRLLGLIAEIARNLN